MTRLQIHNAIRARFATQIETGQSLVTVYDNQAQNPPTDGSLWCRFSVRDGDSNRITVGVKRYRHQGVAIAHLYGPIGSGDGVLLAMAEAVVTAFRDVNAGGVTYLTPEIMSVGQEDHNYQINVEVPYQADEQ